MIQIAKDTFVSEDELVFTASRSGGPGGQNVNKLNTRITVLFDVAGSPTLSPTQKQRILAKLPTRIDKAGVLHVTSQRHRTQNANRRATVAKLQTLLTDALKVDPIRKETTIPPGAREKRLAGKRQRASIKKDRSNRDWQDNSAD